MSFVPALRSVYVFRLDSCCSHCYVSHLTPFSGIFRTLSPLPTKTSVSFRPLPHCFMVHVKQPLAALACPRMCTLTAWDRMFSVLGPVLYYVLETHSPLTPAKSVSKTARMHPCISVIDCRHFLLSWSSLLVALYITTLMSARNFISLSLTAMAR